VKQHPTTQSKKLRRQAETALGNRPQTNRQLTPVGFKRAIHELEVHQIELKIQNEELYRVQAELAQSRDRYSDLYDFAPVG
jgi:hypothetical protein